jgi:hypothetical protein
VISATALSGGFASSKVATEISSVVTAVVSKRSGCDSTGVEFSFLIV